MSKYLILGSNSFAGAAFVNYCVDQKNEVVGVNRSKESSALFLPILDNLNKEKYTFYLLDLNKDFNDILDLIDTFRQDFIIDFAGQGMVAES